MTLEQIFKWKRGSFEDYMIVVDKQEKLLKKIRKLNNDIEKAEDARSCFNPDNSDEFQKFKQHDNNVNMLLEKRKQISLRMKKINEQLKYEFY